MPEHSVSPEPQTPSSLLTGLEQASNAVEAATQMLVELRLAAAEAIRNGELDPEVVEQFLADSDDVDPDTCTHLQETIAQTYPVRQLDEEPLTRSRNDRL